MLPALALLQARAIHGLLRRFPRDDSGQSDGGPATAARVEGIVGQDSPGTPVSVVEAAAPGPQVISTLHGGIMEAVIDGQTGFLGPEGDIDAMAQHTIQLARTLSLAASLGQRGRELIVADYSLDKRIAVPAEIIESAIGEHRR